MFCPAQLHLSFANNIFINHTSVVHTKRKTVKCIYIYIYVCVNVSVYVSMRLYVMFLTVYYKIFGSISIIEKK